MDNYEYEGDTTDESSAFNSSFTTNRYAYEENAEYTNVDRLSILDY